MKTSILFMCLVAVAYATVDYPVGLKTLCQNIHECAKELKYGNALIDPLTDIFAWHCALQKVGVIKANRIVKNNGVEYCTAVVPEKNVDSCKKEVTDCIDKESTESKKLGSNIDEPHRQINCVIKKGVINNIDCSMYNVKKNA